jgi:hypothetical protein
MFARIRATATHNLDALEFVEGHELEKKLIKKIPKEMYGRCLSAKEAEQLLRKLAH